MSRRFVTGLALALLLGGISAVEAVTSPSGIDFRLRFDWDVTQNRKGQPVVEGYLYNDYSRAANNVRLLVESLDASGQVIGRSYGYVVGIVPVFNRSYFSVPVTTPGASYRITVTSFEWRDGGSGG